MTSGVKYWPDNSVVAGQQFGYSFDDIGNRKTASAGGDQWGANLRYENYGANNLNQYTHRTVPGAVEVIGSATNTATVTVNNQPTYRKGNYYRAQLSLTNSAGPVYQSVTNLAVQNEGTSQDIISNFTGNVFLPQNPESFTYDADGNLTQDGRWTNTWDAENRLINMTSLSGAPTASKLKLDFTYDYQSRRIQKVVSTNSGSAYVTQSTIEFAYDGWNLTAILNPLCSILNSFTWGTDLSGSTQGAGGVGGLLSTSSPGSAQFTCYDGNGNITALIDTTSTAITGQYEYGPFGEVIRATGPQAKANSFRFSTKYQDDETDLLYYGYRYYSASTGRWLSKDLLSDISFFDSFLRGHPRLDEDKFRSEALLPPFLFDRNNPENLFDLLGLDADVTWTPAAFSCPKGTYVSFIQVAYGGFGAYKSPKVDDGGAGFHGGGSQGCAEYPNFGHPGQFEDSPSGLSGLLTGPLKFITCQICVETCCMSAMTKNGLKAVPNARRIVKTGPCKVWKKGDIGSLTGPNDSAGGAYFQDASASDMVIWANTVSAKYPNYTGCYSCKQNFQ